MAFSSRVRRAAVGVALAGSAVAGLIATAPAALAADGQVKQMRLLDDCDRATWAEIAPGFNPCENVGSVSIDEFRAEFADGGHGAWWINNRKETIRLADTLHVVSEGGLPHTFTRVSSFGTSPIAGENNNALAGKPAAVPGENFGATFVAPPQHSGAQPNGGNFPTARDVKGSDLGIGTHKFQCFLHPWMQTTVTVRA
jgi:hypothetical protein